MKKGIARAWLKSVLVLMLISVSSICAFADDDAKNRPVKVRPVKFDPIKPDPVKKTPLKEEIAGPEEFHATEDMAVPIPLPQNIQPVQSYFSSLPMGVLGMVEDGSPQALRQVVSLLHKRADQSYAENEKVMLYICSKLMEILYPSQSVHWDEMAVPADNPYVAAIQSAEKKIYDSSTGNSDFLTITLPALIVKISDNVDSFQDDAQVALENSLEIKNNSVVANYLMGLLQLKKKKYGSAIEYLNVALAGAGDVPEILQGLSEAYLRNGDSQKSLECSGKILASNPQNISSLEYSAYALYDMGKIDDAESYVLRVLQLEPENLSFLLMRTKILMDRKDFIRASSFLDAYSKNDMKSRDYLLLRSRLLKDWNKNPVEAGELIQQAMELYPQDMEVVAFAASLASEYNLLISQKSALELSQVLLDMNPDSRSAISISIQEYMKVSKWNDAYGLSSRIVGSNPSRQELSNHIDICIALNRKDEAFKLAQSLYQENPQDETIQQLYIKVLMANGSTAQAKNLISQLLPNASMSMRSFLYYQRSFYAPDEEVLLGDLRSSLTANPRNRDALFRLYKIYYGKRDWKKAQYYLKQVVALNPNDESMVRLNSDLDRLLGK